MAGKIVLTRRVNLYFISGILLFSIIVPVCLADEDAEIYKQKESICALIDAGKFSEAKAATAQMTIEFPGLEKLPDMLYWIAGRYQTFDRFEDAKQIQGQIIKDFPESPWAKKAKMGYSMTEAMSLIMSGKYAEAKSVTDKMTSDFAGSPDLSAGADLPEMLFWITDRYERVDRFDDARRNYQQIVQNFPDSPLARKAKLGVVKETVISLINSKDYENAKTALSNMITDFNDYKELPETLYWINESYELSGKFDEAEQIFKTIQKYPNDLFAQRATLGLRRVEVMRLLAKDSSEAENTLNKMIADFKTDDELPRSVFLIGQKCINDANVPNHLQRALTIFEKVINDLPRTSTIAGLQGDLYFYAGRCCDETEQYPKALTYFQKIVDAYPDFALSWYAQFKLGSIPQKMKEKGTLNPQEADKATKDAYKQLLIKYPDCPNASTAKTWLSENVKEG
jgi:TolA-binding protein